MLVLLGEGGVEEGIKAVIYCADGFGVFYFYALGLEGWCAEFHESCDDLVVGFGVFRIEVGESFLEAVGGDFVGNHC